MVRLYLVKGSDQNQPALVSTITLETYIEVDHRLRAIRKIVNQILAECEAEFTQMYARTGRPSIAPEKLLRALLVMVLYSIRSERQLMEQIRYNLLFRWFVGLDADEAVWDPSTFSENRERLLDGAAARMFFEGVLAHAKLKQYMSEDHFTVDGTLLEAWASQKSFRPKDEPTDPPEGGGSNPDVDFKGQKRSNDTHQSTSDPESRMARKGEGKEAKLSYSGNVLMENRNGLVVDASVVKVEGNHEVNASISMLEQHVGPGSTVGADKLYDQRDFVGACKEFGITAHVAQNDKNRRSCIDGRTTKTPGYETSQKIRKRIEEVFGWMKTVGGLRKLRYRGQRKVDWIFLFCSAAFNLVRITNIEAKAV